MRKMNTPRSEYVPTNARHEGVGRPKTDKHAISLHAGAGTRQRLVQLQKLVSIYTTSAILALTLSFLERINPT